MAGLIDFSVSFCRRGARLTLSLADAQYAAAAKNMQKQ
jgi:hypothetical protein